MKSFSILAKLFFTLAACLCVCYAQTCTPVPVAQPVIPVLESTAKVLPIGSNNLNDPGTVWTATFGLKSCNAFPVPLGACLSLNSPLTGANVSSTALPAAALPGYTRNAFTVTLSQRVDNITVSITTSVGTSSASSGNGSPTGACSGIACGNPLQIPASVRLCTNPCPAGTTTSSFWSLPRPLLTTRVIQPIPQVHCGAQSLSGKNCLVVGGAHGAGRGIAQQLYADGCNVIATSRHGTHGGAYANLNAPAVHPAWLDATKQHSVDNFFDLYIDPLSSLDLVVSTVGAATFDRLEGYSGEDLIDTFQQNTVADYRIARRALVKMGPSDGHNKIIVLTSTSAYAPVPGTGPYAASKVALRFLFWAMAFEQNIFPRYNIANNISLISAGHGQNVVAPQLITIAPESMKTDWGVYDYVKGAYASNNDPRLSLDRQFSLGYIANAGMDPLAVGAGILSVATMQNEVTRNEYMLYNPDPASTDSIGQDLWNSACFNLPIDEASMTMLAEDLGDFGVIQYGTFQNVELLRLTQL